MLLERYPTTTVLRMAKPTFTKPAPAEFLDSVMAAGADSRGGTANPLVALPPCPIIDNRE